MSGKAKPRNPGPELPAKQPAGPPDARGLMLFFENTNLRRLEEQGDSVGKAFGSIGCPFEQLKISDQNALEVKLRKFLAGRTPTKRIVYYQGHGGRSGNELVLSSHPTPEAGGNNYLSVSWAVIKALVMQAERDVLVILDCCTAGLAVDQRDSGAGEYSKEVIVATSWGTKTYGKMALALCGVLEEWFTNSESRSAQSLSERISSKLNEMRSLGREQIKTEINQLNERRTEIKGMKKQLLDEQGEIEKEMKRLWEKDVEHQDTIKRRWLDLPQEIGRLELELEDSKSKIQKKLERRSKHEDLYPQNFHSRFVSRRRNWALPRP